MVGPEGLRDITEVVYPIPTGDPLVFLRTTEVFGREASHLIGKYRLYTFKEAYVDPRKARKAWEGFLTLTGVTIGEVLVELYAKEMELRGSASENLI